MLFVSQLSMRFGAKILFKNVSVQFNPGHRYGLVGANGCGKSTFIKLLTGEMTPESGEVTFPQQMFLGTLNQDHYCYEQQAILDVVVRGKKKLWKTLENKKKLLEQDSFDVQDCDAMSQMEIIIEKEGGYTAEGEAAKLLEGLGIREEWHQRPLGWLSGGYKLRVLLAQVLFSQPNILILDEPTNHLDLYSIRWLENYLRQFEGTLVVSSHDRDFLSAVCTHIADMDYGNIKIYKGNYEEFQEQKRLDCEQKEHMLQKHDKRREDLQGFVDRFRAKASKARQAQSKAKLIEKIEEEIDALDLLPSSRIYPQLNFKSLRTSGAKVLEVKDICKAYGTKKVLDNVSFTIEREEKIAILGPNGIGKSTLLEILTEYQKADQGIFTWGFAARYAYFPQDHGREVKGEYTLLDWLGKFDSEVSQEQLRNILGQVLFSGDVVNQSISTLSGGEKARLLLAKMMLQKPNVLIFDEPTNHLDMEAIEELIESLTHFEGTLLLVSHNRYFVSRLANRIIEISYQGVKDFKGSYAEYLEKQEKDYLASQVVISQRYAQENSSINTAKLSSSHSYNDYKRLKSQKAQLRKKVSQVEDLCHQLEQKIQAIDTRMATEGFYQQNSREEQMYWVQQKQELEIQLLEAMNQWEETSLALQKSEAESE